MRRFIRGATGAALIAVALLLPVPVVAAAAAGSAEKSPQNTLVVISSDAGVYLDIIDSLESDGTLDRDSYTVTVPESDTLEPLLKQADTIITIGTRAAESVYRLQPAAPILSALLTESGFTFLAGMYYGSTEAALEQGVSAIYLDQPLQRLYRLGTLLLPEVERVGVITSDESSRVTAAQFAKDYSGETTVEAVILSSDISPIQQLNPLMRSSGFVMVLPGKKQITLPAARWILQLGSHTRTPVIAYSKKYARSGALASVYTSPENVAEQLAAILAKTQMLSTATAALYPPSAFSIEINRSVAANLGIPVKDTAYYRDEIRRLESSE